MKIADRLNYTFCTVVTRYRMYNLASVMAHFDLLSRVGHDEIDVRFWKSIKCARQTKAIGTPVFKEQPVPHLKFRQVTALRNDVIAATCLAPDTAAEKDFIFLYFLEA